LSDFTSAASASEPLNSCTGSTLAAAAINASSSAAASALRSLPRVMRDACLRALQLLFFCVRAVGGVVANEIGLAFALAFARVAADGGSCSFSLCKKE